jgi:hypothetical protein
MASAGDPGLIRHFETLTQYVGFVTATAAADGRTRLTVLTVCQPAGAPDGPGPP